MKILGKNIHRKRLKWWTIIVLTVVFGRHVEVEGSKKRKKILPWIWRRRLYLFGMQHHGAKLVFDSKYRVRAVECKRVEPHLKKPSPDRGDRSPSFLHAVLVHYPPAETNALVNEWASLAGDQDKILVGYGGPEESFEGITHPNKVFIAQDKIWVEERGGAHSYTEFLLRAADHCIAAGKDGVLITDADAWPCAVDYLNRLCLPPWRAGCDFSAARLRDVTNSSFMFSECPTHTLPQLEKWVRKHGLGDPNADVRVMHHFAPLMYFSRELLEKVRTYCGGEPPSHVEKTLGSYAVHLGASYCSYEDFKVFDLPQWLRFRPNLTKDQLKAALGEGVPLVHPVKNNRWVAEYQQQP